MSKATPRQLDVLRIIRDYRHEYGYSPTLQEIGETMGINKVVVFEHVSALERKQLVCRDKHQSRSLTLTIAGETELPPRNRLVFPVLGTINGATGGAK